MHGVITYNITPLRGVLGTAFVLLVNTLFANVRLIGLNDQYPKDDAAKVATGEYKNFDFIIIGAGAAGCALANKLSEVNNWRILLIEAGGYPTATTEVPGLYNALPNSEEDWNFFMGMDRKTCQATNAKRCIVSRGKVLGGTSTINNMIYARGLPENYDRWGVTEWRYELLAPLFQSMENFKGPNIDNLGTSGNINLEVINFHDNITDMLYDIYTSSGVARHNYFGVTKHYLTIKDGQRLNMAEAFLTPIKNKKNFFLALNSEAVKINMKQSAFSIAESVDVKFEESIYTVQANKEIILTAGSINGPKLLLLSGIGPRNYLEQKKIPLVQDLLGVGINLRMHVGVPLFVSLTNCWDIKDDEICKDDVYEDNEYLTEIYNYIMGRTGKFASTYVNEIVAYLNTKALGVTAPNVAVYHNYFKVNDRELEQVLTNLDLQPPIRRSLLLTNQKRAIIMFTPTILRTKSVGQVFLNDTWHNGLPEVKANILSDEDKEDFQSLYTAFSFITSLTESICMKSKHAKFLDIDVPNCRNFKFCSVYYVKCYIMNMVHATSNLSGSLRMGLSTHPWSVVNFKHQVNKVRRLRIGDSSILPMIIFENTVATDAVLGMRLAEILKGDWLEDYSSDYTLNETVF